ncbi:hypothetical protein WJX74_007908 [Apatococcus lobatus]|uniref:Cyclic nucleotide-binding domain-containing protein n=1 Tax=Apatococcus lobatus TaxID=904363 RepID=A0AAW1RT13_9CHLO
MDPENPYSVSKTEEVLALLNRYNHTEQASNISAKPQSFSGHLAEHHEQSGPFEGEKPEGSFWSFAVPKDAYGKPRNPFLGALNLMRKQLNADAASLEKQASTTDSEKLRIVLGSSEQFASSPRAPREGSDVFAQQLFGSPKTTSTDHYEPAKALKTVRIHPLSLFRKYWDFAVIICVVFSVIVLPFRAAFYWDTWDHGTNHGILFHQIREDWWIGPELLIDIVFIADIFLNFQTGYIKEQVLIMDQKDVSSHYLRTWFILDLIAAFPMDILLAGNRIDVLRLPRVLKVFCISRLPSFKAATRLALRLPFVADMNQFHTRIMRLLLTCLLWVHFDACLLYGAAVAQNYPDKNWVHQANLVGTTTFHKYSWSMLTSFGIMVTAGYGPYNPGTLVDCWVVLFSQAMGVAMFTLVGSMVTTILVHLNASSSEYASKMSALNQYMAHQKLPQDLRQRIRDSYEARWKAEKHFNEEEILEELPSSLRTEVCLHACAELIASVPFFEDAEEGFVTSLVTLLHPQVHLKGDLVCREGEIAREMYFIKSGTVQVQLHGQPVTLLKKGSYFGEIGLLRNARRNASVRAMTDCDLFVLTKEGFDEVMKEYPQMSKAMDLVAEHRIRALHKSRPWLKQQHETGAEDTKRLDHALSVAKHEEHEGKIDELESLGMERNGAADLISIHPEPHGYHRHRHTFEDDWGSRMLPGHGGRMRKSLLE